MTRAWLAATIIASLVAALSSLMNWCGLRGGIGFSPIDRHEGKYLVVFAVAAGLVALLALVREVPAIVIGVSALCGVGAGICWWRIRDDCETAMRVVEPIGNSSYMVHYRAGIVVAALGIAAIVIGSLGALFCALREQRQPPG